MPNPYISVIVSAHDRRRYLPEALHSLESQMLSKNMFEVIVVKNFEDPKSDEIIRRNSWRDLVIPGQTDVVQKIVIGLDEAKGDVITFLEDDDLYTPERLAYVYAAFKKIKGLIWFHNLQHYIDSGGNLLGPTNSLAMSHESSQPPFDFLASSEDPRWSWLLMKFVVAYSNTSSTAVAREVAEGLRGIRGMAPDYALFVIAGLKEGLLFHTTRKLTYYRLGTGFSSLPSSNKATATMFLLTGLTTLRRYGHLCSRAHGRKPLCSLLCGYGSRCPSARQWIYTLVDFLASNVVWGPSASSLNVVYSSLRDLLTLRIRKTLGAFGPEA